jgi:hypothetical protein
MISLPEYLIQLDYSIFNFLPQWDGKVNKWEYMHEESSDNEPENEDTDSDSSDTDSASRRRKSRRLAQRERVIKRQMVCRNRHGLYE